MEILHPASLLPAYHHQRKVRKLLLFDNCLLLFGAFCARFIMSNDLAPKLLHITDIAIANTDKL